MIVRQKAEEEYHLYISLPWHVQINILVWEYLTIFPDHDRQVKGQSPVVCQLPDTEQADKKLFSPGRLLTPHPQLADKESFRPVYLYPPGLEAEEGSLS